MRTGLAIHAARRIGAEVAQFIPLTDSIAAGSSRHTCSHTVTRSTDAAVRVVHGAGSLSSQFTIQSAARMWDGGSVSLCGWGERERLAFFRRPLHRPIPTDGRYWCWSGKWVRGWSGIERCWSYDCGTRNSDGWREEGIDGPDRKGKRQRGWCRDRSASSWNGCGGNCSTRSGSSQWRNRCTDQIRLHWRKDIEGNRVYGKDESRERNEKRRHRWCRLFRHSLPKCTRGREELCLLERSILQCLYTFCLLLVSSLLVTGSHPPAFHIALFF